MPKETTRRNWLEQAVQSTAPAAAVNTLCGVHVRGEESPRVVRLGIVGCGAIMTHHVGGLLGRNEQVAFA